ncbi:zinc/iron-chelating domain-containing protein [Bacillus cereus]|uniref:YkgJ family cysteine cluster protein n=1 Tax=Bacillus pseudomycoides TaxID=64104 RepID=UPI000BF74EFB|nr:YkgJ family cysteine cluster protein [Bacillus pseudomycoides]PEY32591.1 zinc/iron-chelating domain-containing protein [Bacillus cereus]WJE55678.1 YkgJ family cysteine cluster protein [Bacillus cereus]
MEVLPCNGCKGMCCGPVPITEEEFKKIKKKIKSMPTKKRLDLKSQQRYFGTCIFYDEINDRCGIHPVRPIICRAFGYYNNLVCFRKPEIVSAKNYMSNEQPIGILSVDFTWKDFS